MMLALGVALAPLTAAAQASAHGGARTVHALDIDRLGPEALEAWRADPRVRAFVELGERALVEADADFVQERRRDGRWRASRELEVSQVLTVHPRVHCEHGVEALHEPDAFGESGRWHVAIRDRADTAVSPQEKRVDARDVVAWQVANRRAVPKADPDPGLVAIAAAVDASRWRADLSRLERFERQTGTGFNAALGAVAEAFAAIGLVPQRQCFEAAATYEANQRNCNIVAVQPGRSDEWVVLGAHLDSRNAGFDDRQPSPGAEDNASGCAGVIEAARVLAPRAPDANIAYVCFGLEEPGLFGSQAHAALLDPAKVRAMVNLDMIAFDNDARLDAILETRPVGRALLERMQVLATQHTTLELTLSSTTACCSDHVSYLARSIPAVLAIEQDWSVYPWYHTSDDRGHRLSDAMAREIVKLAAVTVADAAGQAPAVYEADGYWYDPLRSGQGWHFERQQDGRAVATWYTFDAQGGRLWLVGEGSVVDGAAQLVLFSADGGRFPATGSAPVAQTQRWGELRLRFDDCRRGRAEWVPDTATGLAAGSAEIVRLTLPAHGSCAAASR
jgi:hypothetical protein